MKISRPWLGGILLTLSLFLLRLSMPAPNQVVTEYLVASLALAITGTAIGLWRSDGDKPAP
jgi:hypothetical protein